MVTIIGQSSYFPSFCATYSTLLPSSSLSYLYPSLAMVPLLHAAPAYSTDPPSRHSHIPSSLVPIVPTPMPSTLVLHHHCSSRYLASLFHTFSMLSNLLVVTSFERYIAIPSTSSIILPHDATDSSHNAIVSFAVPPSNTNLLSHLLLNCVVAVSVQHLVLSHVQLRHFLFRLL